MTVLKKGYTLIYALIFLMVIAFVGFFILSYQNKTNQTVINSAEEIKNDLIARSATEFAIMALQAHDFINNGCVNKINYSRNEVNVTITPIYFLKDCSVCNNLPPNRCFQIDTTQENGNALFYTVIKNNITGQRIVHITYQKL